VNLRSDRGFALFLFAPHSPPGSSLSARFKARASSPQCALPETVIPRLPAAGRQANCFLLFAFCFLLFAFFTATFVFSVACALNSFFFSQLLTFNFLLSTAFFSVTSVLRSLMCSLC
jgi:hypothetical protein